MEVRPGIDSGKVQQNLSSMTNEMKPVVAHSGVAILHQPADSLTVQRKQSLERKLLCRRSVNELAEQGIYPPLKSPAAFHEQTRHLERAKTGDILKHKIEHRPDRLVLIAQNILDESAARPHLDPAIQARQRQLKKARLIGDLNDRLARRPGPVDLVQILEPDQTVRERIQQVAFQFTECNGEQLFDDDDQDDSEIAAGSSGHLDAADSQAASVATDESETFFAPSSAFNDNATFDFDVAQARLTSAGGDAFASTSVKQSTPPSGDHDRQLNASKQSYSISSISPSPSVSSSLVTYAHSQPTGSQRQSNAVSASTKKVAGTSGSVRTSKSTSITTPNGAPRTVTKQRVNLKFHFYTGPPTKRTDRVKSNSCSASQSRSSSSAAPSVTQQSSASPSQQTNGTPDTVTPTDAYSPTNMSVNIRTPSIASSNFRRILEQQTVLLQLQNETECAPRDSAIDEEQRLLEHLDELKVTDLRNELRRRGQRTQGTKNELADRLRSALLASCGSPQPAAIAEQPVIPTSADSPCSTTMSFSVNQNASSSLQASSLAAAIKVEGPSANLEALMQQLQQEIEYEQVQTRLQETNARLAAQAAASQPPCYLLNSNQPVILVNLPGAISTQTTTCNLSQPPTLALAAQSSLQSAFPSSQNGLFQSNSVNSSMQNGLLQQTFSAQNCLVQTHAPQTVAQRNMCGMPIVTNSNSVHHANVTAENANVGRDLDVHADGSAMVDDVLDILIRNGDLSPSAAHTPNGTLSIPSTVNVVSAIGKRNNQLGSSAIGTASLCQQHVTMAANDRMDDGLDMAIDMQSANSSNYHYRFALAPNVNGQPVSQGEAMESTAAPSPLPAVVSMDDCSLFGPVGMGGVPQSHPHNIMDDSAAAAEFTEQFGDELLSLINANGLSNVAGLSNMGMQVSDLNPSGCGLWNGPDADPFLLGSAPAVSSTWYSTSAGDIDLNSLMYSSVNTATPFARNMPSESASSPQTACDSLRCDR